MDRKILNLYWESYEPNESYNETEMYNKLNNIVKKYSKQEATKQLKSIIENIPNCYDLDPPSEDKCTTNLSGFRWFTENENDFFLPLIVEILIENGAKISDSDINKLFDSMITIIYDFDGHSYFIREYMVNYSVLEIIKIIYVNRIKQKIILEKVKENITKYKKTNEQYSRRENRNEIIFSKCNDARERALNELTEFLDYIHSKMLEDEFKNKGKLPGGTYNFISRYFQK